MEDAATALAPIEIGRILADTFELVRNRAATVFGIALIAIIPSRLLVALIPIGIRAWHITSYWGAFSIGAVSAGVVGGVIGIFGQGALIGAALARREGAKSGFLETLGPALRRFPAIVAVALLAQLGVALGLVLLVVPGMIAAMMWSVAGPVLVAERTGVVEALRRSQTLTENLLWRIFLLMLTVGIGAGAFGLFGQWFGKLIFALDTGTLDYPFAPGPFLFGSLIRLITVAFNLAFTCTLYLALIAREGGGPMADRLTRIFE